MPTFISPPPLPLPDSPQIGVLLVNLGTPDATDYWTIRKYLKQFLSDPRVIETPRLIWWFVLNLIILTFRPPKTARNYASIWNKEQDESPLKTITRMQVEALVAREKAPSIHIEWAMRYGNPSIASGIDALQAKGCDRILVLPLYPQYCAATSASVCDALFDHLKKLRRQPYIRIAPPWFQSPVYVEQLVKSARQHMASLDFEPEVLLLSFHGVPFAFVEKGDPYQAQCEKTAALFTQLWGDFPGKIMLTFQSRFGPTAWLQPYTDETVRSLAEQGIKKLAIMTPGFVADCVETLEEIAQENKEIFMEHGGESFALIPCLNASPEGIDVLEHVIQNELSGWV